MELVTFSKVLADGCIPAITKKLYTAARSSDSGADPASSFRGGDFSNIW